MSEHVTNFAGDCIPTCPACSAVTKAVPTSKDVAKELDDVAADAQLVGYQSPAQNALLRGAAEIKFLRAQLWTLAELIFYNASSNDAQHWARRITVSIKRDEPPTFAIAPVETSEPSWVAAADRLLEKVAHVGGIEVERRALIALMPSPEEPSPALCPNGHPAKSIDLDVHKCDTCGWIGYVKASSALHFDTCNLKYGGAKCTCGAEKASRE